MIPRIPKLFLLVALSVSTIALADEAKKCTVSARECEQTIRQMLSGRRYLGLQVVELKPAGGLIVKGTVPDSPAARADFQAGDRLIAINGHYVTDATVQEFKKLLSEYKETGKLWIIVQRRGALRKIEGRLEPYTKAQIDKIVAQHLLESHPATASASPQPQAQQ